MQYSQLILIITYCLMVTILSNAMDYTNRFDLDAIEEITAVKEPWRVRYVTDKKLAILGKNGCCSIFDLQTKESQCIANANGNPFISEFPIVESNNNKIIVAHGAKVIIYDGDSGKEESISILQGIKSLALHPIATALFLCYGENRGIIAKYNYVSKEYKNIPILDQYCQLMTIHPQKEMICIANFSGNISLRKLDNIAVSLKTITLPICCEFCKYNLDGSCIIAGNANKLYIINPDEDTNLYPVLKVPKYKNFYSISFHPNGLILATLSGPLSLSSLEPYIIYYWNLKTQQLIGEASMILPGAARDICFSDDGLEVVVALKDKCIRMLVPFAVKDKYSHALFVLNQLKEQNNLPKDIVKYCMHILLKHVCL